VFAKPAALEYGMDKLFQSLQVLDSSAEQSTSKSGPREPGAPEPRLALPLKPPLGRVG